MDIRNILNQVLSKVGMLSSDQQLSITNITVMIFVLITAIRSLFGGSTLHIGTFNWAIQTIDYSDTLPLLFSLLNYTHKRLTNNQNPSNNGKGNDSNA